MIINWTACSSRMPPEDGAKIIAFYGSGMIDKMPSDIFHMACKLSQKVNGKTNIQWTEYTKEKWDYLNDR